MLDPRQLRAHIIRPVLIRLGLHSPEAEELMLGTAAVESALQYIKQLQGPAIGLYQIEPQTVLDLLAWLQKKPEINRLARTYLIPDLPAIEQITGNLYWATTLCRLYYYRIPLVIPKELIGWAAYWKRHYNTPLGKGTEQKFIDAYNRLIKAS